METTLAAGNTWKELDGSEQRHLLIFNCRHLEETAPVDRLFIQLNTVPTSCAKSP